MGVRFDFAHAHCVDHADVARQHPHRHVSRSSMASGDNSGYRLPAECADGGDAAEAGWATGRQRSSARSRCTRASGLNQGFDRLRRSLRRNARADRVRDAGAPGVRGRAARARSGSRAKPDGKRQPWFAWVHLFDPHAPHTGRPPPFDATVCRPVHAWRRSRRPTRRLRRCSTIFARRIAPTLVVVTGDHGEGLGDHGELAPGCSRTNRRCGSADRWPRSAALSGSVDSAHHERRGFSSPEQRSKDERGRRGIGGRGAARRHPSNDSRGRGPGAAIRSAGALAAAAPPSGGPVGAAAGLRISRRWARCSIADGHR